MPWAHVAIATEPDRLLADADAALAFLSAADVPPDFRIEATYWPETDIAVVLVSWPGPL